MIRRLAPLPLALALLAIGAPISPDAGLEAQIYREAAPPALRIKPHEVTYVGVLEVVGEVGGREQYRIGPDTLLLRVNVQGEGDDMMLDYALDLAETSQSTGTIELSELGFEVARYWKPALEMLTLLTIVPLTEEPQPEMGSWTEITAQVVPEIDLEFAEATRFVVESIEDDVATISFSAEGGGTTAIARPQLGPDAIMAITREVAREGTFVFDIEAGYVTEATRLERITNRSVVAIGGEEGAPTEEVQTVRIRLVPMGG